MKHTKKKKQAKHWQQIQQFFNAYPVEVAMEMLRKMLKYSLSKNDKVITEQERSRLINFYQCCLQLLDNSYRLTKKRKN